MGKLFGEAGRIPGPVNVNDLTAPGFDTNSDDYIPFEPVKDNVDSTDDPLAGMEDMFSDNIEDLIDGEEGKVREGKLPGAGNQEQFDDEGISVDMDDLDAEMICEFWQDIRFTAHSGAYDWAVFKDAKKARELLKELSLNKSRTTVEDALMEELWNYVGTHEGLREEYLGAVPYTEKHQAMMLRYVQFQIEKARLQGKKLPTWLIPVYIFLVPEIKMAAKFMKLKQEIPHFNFDVKAFKKENG